MQHLPDKTRFPLIPDGSDQGFTLIELIAGLVLLGILTTVFGLGIAGALNIYSVSEENVHLAQKGQIALSRINRELMELTELISHDPAFIIYKNLRSNTGDAEGIHAIAFDSAGNRLLLYSDLPSGTTDLDTVQDSDADLLLEQVSDFRLIYHQGANADPEDTTNTWDGVNERYLSHIRVNLTMSRNGNIATNNEMFTSLVYLRNTLNYGGAAPATEPPTPPGMDSYSCFVKTVLLDERPGFPAHSNPIKAMLLMLAAAGLLKTVSYGIHQFRKSQKGQSGSALIAIIAAILIFSTIAAALLPLVSSSGHQAVAQDHSEKAYLMAESGFRYAAGQYVNAASDTEKLQALEDLHNSFYSTDQGAFALHLYAYFFEVQEAIPINATAIHTRARGAVPSGIEALAFQSNLSLMMTTGTQILNVDRFSVTGSTVTFHLAQQTQETISAGTLIFPAAAPAGSQSLVNGGTIVASDLDMFPSHNGYITLAGRRLNYRYKDSAANRLVGVVDLNDADMSLTITNTDDIVLNRHVQLVSTGFYGSGDFQVSRTVTYDTPLYFSGETEKTTTIEDTFDDADLDTNWNSVWGDNTIEEVDGNRRLDVIGQSSPASAESSLIALDSDDAQQAFRASYQSSGNYLSYDTQVKVGFGSDPSDPTVTDADDEYYFAAGLSFRLNVDADENLYNSYGVSIMRGNPAYHTDWISDGIVPEEMADKLALVLWRQTDNGEDSSWLAYKDIDALGWPVQDATLVVRIKEAVVLQFDNGGAIPIQKGNVVIGDNSGAHGRVIQGPILSSGTSWGSSGAAGRLLLNNNSGAFQNDEDLRVVGRGVLAKVASDSYSSQRVNIIRVYVGRSGMSEDTCVDEDDGTSSPLDETMICYPLGTSPLVWPPDLAADGAMNWPEAEDYFQLVQWDDFNGVTATNSAVEPNAIIIHQDDDLQTDESGDLGDRAEIGLHAFGKGTENIYFDDFGLQLTSRVSAVIPTPIQQ